MKHQHHNFNVERERAEHTEEDWQFGALSQPALVSIPLSERDKWLPKGENQSTGVTDTSGCVSRAFLNILAPQFTYGYQNKIFTEKNCKWLEEKGYVVDGKIDFSDRAVEIGSGTTREGNSLKAPINYIHSSGLIPKAMFPTEQGLTFEEYYDKSKITKEMTDLGEEFARRFTINYEQVREIHFPTVLADDMLVVGLYAWSNPVNGEYPRADFPMNHAVMMFKLPAYYIFDNYNFQDPEQDWIKKLAQNYDFFEWGYRPFISAQNDTIYEQITLYEKVIGLLQQLLAALKR